MLIARVDIFLWIAQLSLFQVFCVSEHKVNSTVSYQRWTNIIELNIVDTITCNTHCEFFKQAPEAIFPSILQRRIMRQKCMRSVAETIFRISTKQKKRTIQQNCIMAYRSVRLLKETHRPPGSVSSESCALKKCMLLVAGNRFRGITDPNFDRLTKQPQGGVLQCQAFRRCRYCWPSSVILGDLCIQFRKF